jgi:glycosyltransferase involved in cell wall biosynthesis
MNACWYVTHSWSVHDDRWLAALMSQGFEVRDLSLSRDHLTVDQIRQMITNQPELPVLAGPLTSITSTLLPLPNRCVGLSWGFDLIEIAGHGTDASWLPHLDHLIVDSPITHAIAREQGMPAEGITCIPWGVDLQQFTPIPTSTNEPIVLSLRGLEALYRVSDLIAAWPAVMKKYPRARLLIGNQGSLRESLEAQAGELGIGASVTFLGSIPEGELPELFGSVTLYVSTSPVDGTSVTMLQAMACRAPVLVTDTPANRVWIEPGDSGFVFPVGDIDLLASSINDILTAEGAYNVSEITAKARQIVEERADWQRNSRMLRGILLGD